MSITKDDIQDWFETSRALGYKYMIIVTDTFDYDSYPIYTKTLNDFLDKFHEHNGNNMQRIEEVYDLSMDMVDQLYEERAWHLPEGFKDTRSD